METNTRKGWNVRHKQANQQVDFNAKGHTNKTQVNLIRAGQTIADSVTKYTGIKKLQKKRV